MCQYGQHVRIGGKSVHIGRKVSVLAHPKIIVDTKFSEKYLKDTKYLKRYQISNLAAKMCLAFHITPLKGKCGFWEAKLI